MVSNRDNAPLDEKEETDNEMDLKHDSYLIPGVLERPSFPIIA